MNRLQAEWHRLYLPTRSQAVGEGVAAPGLIAPDGRVRALVMELSGPPEWTVLAKLWQGVQDDAQWPAPAIAVSGVNGYQLWFSLEESITLAQAQTLLEALRSRYWGDVAPERVKVWPAVDAHGHATHARLVPSPQDATGFWSAFVAPGLAALLEDEPWLDLPPSVDAQADLLCRLKSVPAEQVQLVIGRAVPAQRSLLPVAPVSSVALSTAADECACQTSETLDPKTFLLRVMNDPAVDLHLRIDAAKALLPVFEQRE